jgi:hypothetical protein
MADLYYCNACGLRLKPEELEIAVSRGESPASACCEKCSKPGRQVKAAANPLISDIPLLDAQDLPRSPKPTPVKGARATPPGNSTPSGRQLRNTPDGVIRPEVARAARNSPAGGVRIDNLRAQRGTPAASVRPETSQAARVTRRGSAATGSDRRGGERPAQRDAGLPLASLLAGAGAVLFLVGIFFATHSGNRTVEADSRTTATPASSDSSKGDEKRSGDNSPKLPDVKRPPMSGADERRMADFERGLPQSIGAAPRGNVIYGPLGASSQAVWKEGRESLYKPEGKPPFLDGSQKVFFQLNGSAGSVTKETFVIEYSAANNIDVYVYLDLADFGSRGGMVRFPAGSMQKIEISPDDDSVLKLGKRGNASGHAINGFGFEAKGVQPGTFGVFRISR